MIEDYQAKRRRARFLARGLLITGVVVAVLGAIAAFLFVQQAREAAGIVPVTTTNVLVASRDIAPRTTLAAGDVKVVRVSPEIVPSGALREASQAVGRVVTAAIAQNEVVLPSKFVAADGQGPAPFSVFPAGETPSASAPDYRAMSLSIPEANAVAGAVQAGDIVDIVLAIGFDPAQVRPGSTAGADFAARIIAERVPILARAGGVYVIRVDAQQAERLAALQLAGASLHLLLRGPGDTRDARARGALGTAEVINLIRTIPAPSPLPAR